MVVVIGVEEEVVSGMGPISLLHKLDPQKQISTVTSCPLLSILCWSHPNPEVVLGSKKLQSLDHFSSIPSVVTRNTL